MKKVGIICERLRIKKSVSHTEKNFFKEISKKFLTKVERYGIIVELSTREGEEANGH